MEGKAGTKLRTLSFRNQRRRGFTFGADNQRFAEQTLFSDAQVFQLFVKVRIHSNKRSTKIEIGETQTVGRCPTPRVRHVAGGQE